MGDYTKSCNTQSSVPEDWQNNYPKHVELTGIMNKPLLLRLVGCLYYLYPDAVYSILKMEAVGLFITLVSSYKSTLYQNPENCHLKTLPVKDEVWSTFVSYEIILP